MKNKSLKHIKSNGFTVPKDYFETFEKDFFEELHTKTIIDTTSSGFTTPEGYFDALEDRIIKNKHTEVPKVISIFNRKNLVYISGIAAAVLILFNISVFDEKFSIENLETASVENYILEEDITSYEVAALFNEELPKETDFINYNLDDENLEEYVLKNIDVENLMIEQYQD
ncbi:hypothetical protein MHTCC0001_13780 [Flavobacteriaceae bacterium MHTCC 0001]